MGCGASSGKKEKQEQESTQQTATWATKTDVRVSSDANTSQPEGGAVASKGGLRKDDQIRVMDPDDESEIEIIYEGKKQSPKQHNAANAQEAPEAVMEADEVPEGKDVSAEMQSSKEQPKSVLSQRQKEEAAKMAASRNLFDNQRFGAITTTSGQSSSGNGVSVITMSGTSGQASGTGTRDPQRLADAVMGLNLTDVNNMPGEPMFEALPGGIDDFDTPRAEAQRPLPKQRNKHAYMDDDDEQFMQEILQELDV